MKKLLALLLSLVLTLSLFGCGSAAPAETTAAPEPTQSPEEQEVLKFLIIGNSHSNDAFWQLFEVFKAQAPEQKVLIGILYYSGCPITKHVQFGMTGEKVYDYYRNSTGVWEHFEQSDMQSALRDQKWDIIFFQPSGDDIEYAKETRDALANLVAADVDEPYDLYLHKSWVSPNDETFYSPTYDPQPPSGWRDKLVNRYGFDLVNYSNAMNENVKTKLLDDDMFTKFIGTNAAILHAHYVSGVPQLELWRDYTHLSDYGRLIVAYTLYSQIMDDPITEVKVESIAAELRHRRAKVLGDMEVTDEMRQVIIDAVKYATEHPWEIPVQN